jgi:hypothetical protein
MTEKTKKFKGSFGTIAFIETPNGDLRLNVDVFQGKHTTEEMMHRIRAIVCGIKHVYNRNTSEIESLGDAYMDGLETGISAMQDKKKKPEPESGDGGPKIGFNAKL